MYYVICMQWLVISRGLQGDHLSEKSKSQGSVRKSGLKLLIVSCMFASIIDFAELVHFILYLAPALLHTYRSHTNNNTSTVMIWVTLNMGRSAMNCHRISHCLESGHPGFHIIAF